MTHGGLPDKFLSSECRYHREVLPLGHDAQMRLRQAGIVLPEELASAVEKRKQEFLAGRLCAFEALRHSGAAGKVEFGADRTPVWPVGWVGSITHTEGVSAAVAAPVERVRGIGLDVEAVMSTQTVNRIFDAVMTETERSDFERGQRWSREEFVTLVFSAKESIYKCIRPIAGEFFGFKDARIEVSEVEQGVFNFKYFLDKNIGSLFKRGWQGSGNAYFELGRFHTLVTIPCEAIGSPGS